MFLFSLGSAWALQSVSDPLLFCEAADRVVLAEATSSETVRVEGSDDLRTTTWLHVYQTLSGDPAPETVELVADGGVLGAWFHYVEHQPRLQVDHRYVLFLDAGHPARIVGAELGVFDVGHSEEPLQTVLARLGSCL